MTTTQLETASDQLWDRWPYLSHEQRLKQFRELHTCDLELIRAFAKGREESRPYVRTVRN